MTLESKLLGLERQLWMGDMSVYLARVDEMCLVAFSSMAGVMSREQLAETVKDSSRWREVEMTQSFSLPLEDNVVALSYQASAIRDTGERYVARVSSVYLKRDKEWKLAFHQQTPLEKT